MIICTWGEKGASLSTRDGAKCVAAHSPEKVIDTLGAGDTFCAAAIHSLLSSKEPTEAVEFACCVAGTKVGMYGYDGLSIFCSQQSGHR